MFSRVVVFSVFRVFSVFMVSRVQGVIVFRGKDQLGQSRFGHPEFGHHFRHRVQEQGLLDASCP